AGTDSACPDARHFAVPRDGVGSRDGNAYIRHWLVPQIPRGVDRVWTGGMGGGFPGTVGGRLGAGGTRSGCERWCLPEGGRTRPPRRGGVSREEPRTSTGRPQHTVKFPADLTPVIDNDLCIGCGACVAADPSIDLVLHPEKLLFEPSHPGNELAARVCPAIAIDYAGLQARRFPGAQSGPFGVVQSVALAQSGDFDRNLHASSGGIIKELLVDFLEQDEVDGVIALGHVKGLEFEPRLITVPQQVDELPGSIYHNLPKHRVLDILREKQGKYVLVAIPC